MATPPGIPFGTPAEYLGVMTPDAQHLIERFWAGTATAPARRGWARWAVLLAVGLAVLRLAYRPAAPAPRARAAHPAAPVLAPLISHANTGATPLRLPLPDGSVVTLQPGSEVAYHAPFVQSRRDISLRGAAVFAVAKDAAHPFTVLAMGLRLPPWTPNSGCRLLTASG